MSAARMAGEGRFSVSSRDSSLSQKPEDVKVGFIPPLLRRAGSAVRLHRFISAIARGSVTRDDLVLGELLEAVGFDAASIRSSSLNGIFRNTLLVESQISRLFHPFDYRKDFSTAGGLADQIAHFGQ